MGLEIHFTHAQSADCKTITITDTTGDYNVDTNPTGWGGVNPSQSDVTFAQLLIEKGSSSYTVDLLALGFPVTGTVDLTALSVTGAEKWDDGEYTFTLTMAGSFNGDPFESSDEICPYLICQVCCCVKQKWIKGKVNDGKHADRVLASDLLSILIANVQCGETETADEALAELQKLCTNCGCC